MIGQTISHYKVVEKLGQGGMGVVYKAEDLTLDRLVALKFLAPHLVSDEDSHKRFIREAKAAATLDHPNICTVYEIGEAEGRTFIAMAYVEGHSLEQLIAQGPFKIDDALELLLQVARALAAAHDKGIVHRDIKPGNILIANRSSGKDRQAKLVDFGLAQFAGGSKITKMASTIGTVAYMSPEQTSGKDVDHRTDIWALGVVLYRMVTGQMPFKGHYDAATIYSILNEEPEPLTAVCSGASPELERIVNKALGKNPDERYQHMDDLIADLRARQRVWEHEAHGAGEVSGSARARVKNTFLEVCDLEPEIRRQRMEELCGDNRELRREFERWLQHDSPDSILDSPAPSAGRAVGEDESACGGAATEIPDPWIGRTVQSYKLLALLGRGGMGKVYRAEDIRLKRPVAVKFLASRFLHDDRQKKRFLREAQAAAALDHPSICQVYDVGEMEGRPFSVTAFIEGENLAEVIQSGDLPVATTLDYVIQIAEGLHVAHLRGIVHRDMKPGNVILGTGRDGEAQVKIIDFGLARISGFTHLTEGGAVIGTAAYIAPEILQGLEIDPRADIWSLGVMLYEMLTGQRPFDADNRERLFYEICNEEAAPLAAVRPTLPEDAARIVAKALEKDRNRRYQHASEICSDLRRLKRDLESIKTVIVPEAGDEPAIAPAGSLASAAKAQPASGKSSAATVLEQPEATARRLWKVVAVVGAVALAGILVVVGFTSWYAQQQTARQPELSRRQLTTNSSEVPVSAAAISPDGKYLAYADDTGIYVRVIETGERHLLSTAVSGFATSKLSWFPDGIRLVASGTAAGETAPSIWALSILRGVPLKLRADARGASVSPNGSQIAFLNGNATEIWLMGGNGEEPQRFVAADEGYFLLALAWFPDSERLGYLRRGHGETRSDVSILSRDLKESQSVAVFADPKLVAFCILSDGRLLVSRGVDGYTELNKARGDSAVRPLSFELWEIGTNPRTGQASGSPRRVSNWTGPPLTDLSATADRKRLAYLEGPAQYDVYTAELEGNGLRLKPPRRLTLDDSLDIPSAWTPDGKEILFVSDRDGTFDIFKQAIDQRTAEAIVVGPGDESDPIVSSDGAWILYFDDPVHRRNISTEPVTLRRVPVSGGPSQVVLKEPGLYLIGCTGSKAKAKLCVMDKRVGDELIFYAFDPVQGMGRELARIHAPNIRHYWRLSPDGSSIAMPTRERGGGIRIVSLTGKPSRGIFVNEPVDHVLWSADGRGFYATTVDTNLVPWAVAGGSLQKLLYIDLDGHTQTLWRSGNFAGVYGLPSPDGRYLALGMGRMLGNAWMVENF